MKGDTTLFLEIIIFVIFHKFPRKAPLVKSILSKAMLTKKDTVTQDIWKFLEIIQKSCLSEDCERLILYVVKKLSTSILKISFF